MVKKIQDYTLLETIGEGSYGEVFKATHIHKPGFFAIKVITNKLLEQNPKVQECLINEVKVLSKITPSQNIIEFYELIRSRNNHYFVYEYCSGGTLQQKLKDRKYISEKEALQYFSQILSAFKVLNKYKVMHRDLKPENILFHSGVVKLADFGLCKGLKPEENLTKTMLGSPIYMAPEILKGEAYNTKADIWSLGVILYEMLYGFCPYQSNSIVNLVNKIDYNNVQFKEEPVVSNWIKNILRKMLVKDHFRRISWVQLFGQLAPQNSKRSCFIERTSKSNLQIPSIFESTKHIKTTSKQPKFLQKQNKNQHFSSAKYMEYLNTNLSSFSTDRPKKQFEEEQAGDSNLSTGCQKFTPTPKNNEEETFYNNLLTIHEEFLKLKVIILETWDNENMLAAVPEVLKVVRDKLTVLGVHINKYSSKKYFQVRQMIKQQILQLDTNITNIKVHLNDKNIQCIKLKDLDNNFYSSQFRKCLKKIREL